MPKFVLTRQENVLAISAHKENRILSVRISRYSILSHKISLVITGILSKKLRWNNRSDIHIKTLLHPRSCCLKPTSPALDAIDVSTAAQPIPSGRAAHAPVWRERSSRPGFIPALQDRQGPPAKRPQRPLRWPGRRRRYRVRCRHPARGGSPPRPLPRLRPRRVPRARLLKLPLRPVPPAQGLRRGCHRRRQAPNRSSQRRGPALGEAVGWGGLGGGRERPGQSGGPRHGANAGAARPETDALRSSFLHSRGMVEPKPRAFACRSGRPHRLRFDRAARDRQACRATAPVSSWAIARGIVAARGVAGLWSGTSATVSR